MTASSSLPFAISRSYDCLRADISYFLCCTCATKEIGDVCTQATAMMDHDA